jgi:DNA repair exonuclease SbcCD ATPase subunit
VKLRRLYIGDMGIYRNVLMENINPKIVVIGGLNRSGKTTLLEVLRHMAYGYPKGIRDVKTEYFVEGDFVDEQNKQYTVKINGQREPQISAQGDDSILAKGLYGNVDRFTYSQLYTITLDELKKSNVKSDEEKLQSVLLGAGLKDIVHLPKIAEEFKKEKEKLGGKHGNPSTKSFKPYYDKLLEGISGREEALKLLEEYENKCEELKRLQWEIEHCDEELNKFNEKITVLEGVKAYYKQYEDKKTLELQMEALKDKNTLSFSEKVPSLERIQSLNEEYNEIVKQYENLKQEFEGRISSDIGFYERLLQAKEDIRGFQKQLSGLMERLENHKVVKATCDRDKEQLKARLNTINSSWKEDFSKVTGIDCDSIEQDKLLSIIDELNDCETERKQSEGELQGLQLQKEMLEKEIHSLKGTDLGILMKKYLYISLSILLAGAFLFILSKPLGGALALVGAVAASLYFVMRYSSEAQLQSRKSSLVLQLNALNNRVNLQEEKKSDILSNINILKNKLNYFKNKLELFKEISPMGLLQYFKDVQELKKDILNLSFSEKTLDRLHQEIKLTLLKANELISRLAGQQLFKEQDIFKFSRELCLRLEELNEQLSHAEKLAECEARLFQFENRVRTLLNIPSNNVLLEELDKIINLYKIYNQYNALAEKMKIINRQLEIMLNSEKIKKSFTYICEQYNINEENELLSFQKLLESFSTEDQLRREFDGISSKLQEYSQNLEYLKEQKQVLSSEIKALSTSEKLIDSQRVIDEQRAALKELAVKYSIYSTAEFILESIQKNFIDNAKDTILGGAGSIFNKITGGQYKALLPGDNLLQTDFKAMTYDGQIQNSVSMLSRGTGEQLYLSVRLNRIKEMKEKLPLILDDPFVNFDSLHVKNTLRVMLEATQNNQVFIFTCHSELIKLVNDISSEVQYWKLDKGDFELSNCEELIQYLL